IRTIHVCTSLFCPRGHRSRNCSSSGVDLRRLGSSDLTLTPIGLGTWAIGGGDWVLGWGPPTNLDSVTTIRRAIDQGINWIDTAAVYGLGQSETLIARALREIPRNERPYVFKTSSRV